MPIFDFECQSCHNIFDDIIFTGDPLPSCPQCQESEAIKKLPSLVATGIVKLTGHEYKQKVLADGKKAAAEIKKDENRLANFVGETKYNQSLLGK